MALAMGICFICMGCLPDPMELLREKLYDVPEKIPAGGEVKWSYEIPSSITPGLRSLHVGVDGTINLGITCIVENTSDNSSPSKVFKLFVLNPDGTLKWLYNLNEILVNVPLLAPDGTFYYYTQEYLSEQPVSFTLVALNTDGTTKWTMEKKESLVSTPIIDSAGTIYLATKAEKIYAINPDSTEKWVQEFFGDLHSPGLVCRDGKLYFVDIRNNVNILDTADGKILGAFSIPDDCSLGAIAADGTIYVKYRNEVRAMNPDGTQKWSNQGEDFEFVSSIKLGSDDRVCAIFSYAYWGIGFEIPSVRSRMSALDVDGSLQWSIPTGSMSPGFPGSSLSNLAIGTDGTCYICTDSHKLYAVNPDGSWKWQFENEEPFSATAIGPDGTIYLLSASGILYAVEDTGAVGE
jgi:outer membrane protein assembly factor BamB